MGGTKMPPDYIEIRSNSLIPEEIDPEDVWALSTDRGESSVVLFPRPHVQGIFGVYGILIRNPYTELYHGILIWNPY